MVRRRKQKDLCDLTDEEYASLKKATDERIKKDYAIGNIVVAKSVGREIPDGTLGICFLDVFVDFMTDRQYVIEKAIFQNGYELQLGYNTFSSVTPNGQTENIDEWIEKNVNAITKRKKRNS